MSKKHEICNKIRFSVYLVVKVFFIKYSKSNQREVEDGNA